MARIRVSTTVDDELLRAARRTMPEARDSSLLEAALESLIRAHRSTEIDGAYADAYSRLPLDQPDEWGDLAGWRAAVSTS
ncbi:antitoxin MazE5 [Knoellia locipacati]|uniref:antitoxin MazE5 n=1 Tax=Knoellia locipacati TaxID=882824 RepID=UPI00384C7592